MSESSLEESTSHDVVVPPEQHQQFQPLMLDKYLEVCPDADTQGDYSFTGVWHSAKGFLDFLLQMPGQGAIQGNILELGAGTGWLGITLAQSLAERETSSLADGSDSSLENGQDAKNAIVLTDRQGTWLETNLEEAQAQGIPGCKQVSCVGLDWKRKSSVRQVAAMKTWDWIIGSDLVYSEDGVKHLAGAMQILATETSKARIIYAHTAGRMAELDQQWEQELQSVGLKWNVLAELPVISHDNKVWEGRSTRIMDIYRADK